PMPSTRAGPAVETVVRGRRRVPAGEDATMWKTTLSTLAACGLLAACGQGPEAAAPPAADAGYQKVLQQQLLDAKPGDVIEIPAGRHALDRSLSLRVDGVTIRGAGMDKSILSFKGQRSGAEGLVVNADDF